MEEIKVSTKPAVTRTSFAYNVSFCRVNDSSTTAGCNLDGLCVHGHCLFFSSWLLVEDIAITTLAVSVYQMYFISISSGLPL
jgi:hypothetical protein